MDRPSGASGWVAASLSLCLAVGACGNDQVADSPPLPVGAPVGVSDTPVLVVGEHTGDPDHELFQVVTPFLLPDGDLAVPLASEGTIRVFDREGALIRTLGSSGQGPGEFMRLSAAWARGDTIEALDPELGRVTRFVPDEAPEIILLEGVASAQTGVPGLDGGGWVLYGVKEVGRTGRDVMAVHHFAPDGRHVAELGEAPGLRRHVHDAGSGPDPISPRPLVRTDGDRVYVAETLTPRVREFDVSTGETRSFSWEPAAALGNADAVAMARDRASEPGGSPMDEAWTRASFDALTGAEEVPVFHDVLVDSEAFFWIRDYDPRIHSGVGGLAMTGPGGTWTILDDEGNHLTTVTLPDDLEPLAIDADHLIGVRRDELDVESVRVYRIERSGG